MVLHMGAETSPHSAKRELVIALGAGGGSAQAAGPFVASPPWAIEALGTA